MSQTHKKEKPPGTEYWKSRLHKHGEEPGKITKKLTAKKERRKSKEIILNEGGGIGKGQFLTEGMEFRIRIF